MFPSRSRAVLARAVVLVRQPHNDLRPGRLGPLVVLVRVIDHDVGTLGRRERIGDRVSRRAPVTMLT
jgi:hypothetical protein